MTIYTANQNEKDKAKLIPEVVTGHVPDDSVESASPRLVQVTFFRRNGRSFYVHLLFALAVLVILACGALGAVVFYRHLHKKVYSGKCGAVYFDTAYHKDFRDPMAEPMTGMKMVPPPQMDYIEEDISVTEDEMFEELHTPAFDEVRESYIRHSFIWNFTAIVDHEYKRCFVMSLNRSAIAPPKPVMDLLRLALMSHANLRRARVIRQDFQVAYVMEDLSLLGKRFARNCANYPTLWLEKKVSGVYKRSVATQELEKEMEQDVQYAMMSNFPEHQVIYKLSIHNLMKQPLALPLKSGNPATAA